MSIATRDSLKLLLSSRYFSLGLSLFVSGVTLYLAVQKVTWGEVWGSLSQADWRWAGLAVISVIVNTLTKIIRWRLLTSTALKTTSVNRMAAAFLAGQLINSIYPGRVGDFGRAYVTGDEAGRRAFLLGTIVLEKALDMAAYALLAILMILWMPMPGWIHGSVAGIALSGLGILVFLGVAEHVRRHRGNLPGKLSAILDKCKQVLSKREPGEKLISWLKMGSDSLKIVENPWLLVWALSSTVLVWGTAILNNWLVMQAIDLGMNNPAEKLQASIVILVGLIAGITLPSVPGRIGVFEYICVLSLQLFQVSQVMALSYGVLLHAVVFIPQLIAGLLSILVLGLFRKGRDS